MSIKIMSCEVNMMKVIYLNYTSLQKYNLLDVLRVHAVVSQMNMSTLKLKRFALVQLYL